ncbi:MAG: hypothetical protein HKN35_14775 [Woeseia sp.]|nr:hypothetical protein [Woeseia sp.]NNE62156.1 hypothetical protein [Woeseia sp.]
MGLTILAIVGGIVVGILSVYGTLAWLARRRRTPTWNIDPTALPEAAEILPTLAALTNSQTFNDSSVEVIHNGAIFDRIIEDFEQASDSIHLETYVWEAGELEKRMVDTFERAVRRGVNVRLIIDDVGSNKRSSNIFKDLRKAGVNLQIFSPLTPTRLHRFNERTHRKLVIVDGKVAYAMGHGISDHWLGDAENEDSYRDTGVRILGPAVNGLQAVFAREWAALAHELVYGDKIFPSHDAAGDSEICVISSSVGDRYSYVELAFSLAIATATDEILIQNPYFAPDPDIIELLCSAAERGVKVVLMLPGSSTDSYLLRLAARHLYPQLLQSGVSILEYRPTLSHQKVMIVDGILSRVGSTNFDCRSLELNSEAGLIIRDESVAAELKSQFDRDAEHCSPICEGDLKKVSLPARIAMAGVYLLHGQL